MGGVDLNYLRTRAQANKKLPSIYDFLGFFGLYPIFGGSFGVESDFLVFVGVGILWGEGCEVWGGWGVFGPQVNKGDVALFCIFFSPLVILDKFGNDPYFFWLCSY